MHPRTDGRYEIKTHETFDTTASHTYTSDRVILSGGVLGTVPLLLEMRKAVEGLPSLSTHVGDSIRTNSESIIGIISTQKDIDFSSGVSVASILHTDDHSHLEPLRYGKGSGFMRMLMFPHAPGSHLFMRLFGIAFAFLRHPLRRLRAFAVRDHEKYSQILLYMRTLDGTLQLKRGRRLWTAFRRGLISGVSNASESPTAFIKEATDLANRFAEKVNGVTVTLLTETLFETLPRRIFLAGPAWETQKKPE